MQPKRAGEEQPPSKSGPNSGEKKDTLFPTEGGSPEYSADRVDLTLIRWMLSLTPAERLQVLQENIRSLQELRGEPADA